MAISQKSADFFLRSRMADAEAGSVEALYELGVTYSTGRGGVPVDLIEAHKWFNLAALSGDTRSQACRAEISIEMTARVGIVMSPQPWGFASSCGCVRWGTTTLQSLPS